MNRFQCRAARGLLGWSQLDLAKVCEFSETVVNAFETGFRRPSKASLATMRAQLVYAGAIFVDESDGFGVKLRSAEEQTTNWTPVVDTDVNIDGTQARVARIGLGLTLADAARELEIGLSTLVAFEAGDKAPRRSTNLKIMKGYEHLGARFFMDGERIAVSFKATP